MISLRTILRGTLTRFIPALVLGTVVLYGLASLADRVSVGWLIIAIAFALLWHWPLAGSARLAADIERTARTTLDYYELPQVGAAVQRDPMMRRVILSGPADRFQQRELVRIMNEIPGVGSVAWRTSSGQGRSRLMLPLLAEAIFTALAGAVVGMLLAHLVEMRRRANAEWSW